VTQLPLRLLVSPLGSVLIDIERAINARLYYPALLVALTVPEICCALALDKSEFVKEKHYVTFVDKYGAQREIGCDGLTCYRLRGGVVHRANMAGHPKFDATHVVFTIPESGASIHALSIVVEMQNKKAAMFDLVQFCQGMVNAAHRWYENHKDNPKVQSNMSSLIRYCPEGLKPFVGGTPVVGSGE